MATFTRSKSIYSFTFINHSKALLSYQFGELTDNRYPLRGEVKPGERVVSERFQINSTETLEKGNISSIIGFPVAPNPSFRFWSGGENVLLRRLKDQYINLLEGNGYGVTTDTSEISEITGNGLRITVDGGGRNNPSIYDIHIQIYNT